MPGATGLGGIGAAPAGIPAVPNIGGMNLPVGNPASGLSQMFLGNQLQQTFGIAAQMQQQQLQKAQQDQAMSRLQALAAVAGSGNAQLASDPTYKNSVLQAWQQAGLGKTPPVDSQGNLDLAALTQLEDPNIAYKKALAGYDTARTQYYPQLVGSQITKNNAAAQLYQIRGEFVPGQAIAYENLANAKTVLANAQATLLPGETAAKERLQNAQSALDGMLLKYKPGEIMSQADANEARTALDSVEAAYLPLLDTSKANQYNADAEEARKHGELYVQQSEKTGQEIKGLMLTNGLTPNGYYSALRGLDQSVRAGQLQVDSIQTKLQPGYKDPTTGQPLDPTEKAGLVTALANTKAQIAANQELQAKLNHHVATVSQPVAGTHPMSLHEIQQMYPDVKSMNDLEVYSNPEGEKEGKLTYIDKAKGDIIQWDGRTGKFTVVATGTQAGAFAATGGNSAGLGDPNL